MVVNFKGFSELVSTGVKCIGKTGYRVQSWESVMNGNPLIQQITKHVYYDANNEGVKFVTTTRRNRGIIRDIVYSNGDFRHIETQEAYRITSGKKGLKEFTKVEHFAPDSYLTHEINRSKPSAIIVEEIKKALNRTCNRIKNIINGSLGKVSGKNNSNAVEFSTMDSHITHRTPESSLSADIINKIRKELNNQYKAYRKIANIVDKYN